jgi:hypothetical protein
VAGLIFFWSAAVGSADLVIEDAGHGHTTGAVALDQVHNIAVQDAAHAQTADTLSLAQAHNLVVQDADHGQSAENVALIQEHNLVVQDVLHAHAAENVVLEEGGVSTLVVADALHVHSAETTILIQEGSQMAVQWIESALSVRLSDAQTGNGDSTNTAYRGLKQGGAVVITSAIGATPTVTVNIQGSVDGTNFFNIPYALVATPETLTIAAITITTAVTTPNQAWRFLQLVYSANTNVTLTADAYL